MTKKDYIRIAGLFNAMHRGFPDDMFHFRAKSFLVNNMCDIFEEDNPRFDRAKFKEAVYSKSQ